MTNAIDAIRKHLGIRIDDGQLNHYTLLGLGKDASQKEIKQALRKAVAAWNESETKSDPGSAQLVAKLIKQAQAVLLDESKKRVFDASIAQMTSPLDRSLFPNADPFAKFNPTECKVVTANHFVADFGSANDRWNELVRRIPALLHAHPTQVSADNVVSQSALFDSHQIDTLQRSESASARIERLMRKRKLSNAMYLAGFLTVAAGFLVYAGIQFILNRQQIAERIAEQNELDITAPVMKSTPTNGNTPKTIGGSLAPKVPENASRSVLPTLSKEDASDDTMRVFTESNPFGSAVSSPESTPKTVTPTAEASPKATSSTETPPTETPKTGIMLNETKLMVPNMTASAKSAWTAAMKSAREAVEKADFKKFHKQMELALPLSADDEMVAKQARLDQLGQLYEIFIKAVHAAKSKMSGTETLSVGKTRINIVEINDEELIVRMEGTNEHYLWDLLPPGIANAMADLCLSDQEPTDIAARAVYFSLSPARNKLFSKKVQDWFEKSVGKGSVRKDLVQALTDSYE